MIQSLTIKNFRGFEQLKIEPLKRINLLAGENNTGKTAVLEALYLLLQNQGDQLGRLPSVFRSGQQPEDDFKNFWEFLFRGGDANLPPIIQAQCNRQPEPFCQIMVTQERHLRISYHQQNLGISPFGIIAGGGVAGGGLNPAHCNFLALSPRLSDPARDAELYNQASLPGGNEEKILCWMRVVEPRLEKLRYAKIPGTTQPMVYAYVGLKHPIPVTQAGQGFSKLLTVFSEMLVSKAQVLLMDEVENGLYYAILPQVWRSIASLAEAEGIQVFATTHSRECIVAAHEAFKNMPDYNFALHRLQRVKHRLESVTLDRELLEMAVKSGLEVR